MKHTQRFSLPLALLIVSGAALLSCHTSTSLSPTKTSGSTGYSISVKIGGASVATTGSAKSRSIIGDNNVGSVNVAIFDSSSYKLVGYGTLAPVGTQYWGGSISLSSLDNLRFEATANSTSGIEDYYGTKTEASITDGQIISDIGMNNATGTVAWTDQTPSGSAHGQAWYSIASSADGCKLAALAYSGDIWTSTDSGLNWTDQTTSGSAHGQKWSLHRLKRGRQQARRNRQY